MKGYTKPNGKFVTIGENQTAFIPVNLPPRVTYDREMIMLLSKAERTVGELKGKGGELENLHILLRAYLKRDAVLSSKIEGTLASLEDLNRHEAVGNILKESQDNLRLFEVINYVDALEWALKKVRDENRDVDLHIIQEAHRILMTDVRGQEKNPGKLRNQQNWIVKGQGRWSRVVYMPPPPSKVPNLLRNLEEFLQKDHSNIPVLLQCAMVHYQFEAIHPFLDGNGRVGRLLLPLILSRRGLLPEPLLYLSAFFDVHLKEYYNGLLEVSRKSRWSSWIKFFLHAFAVQAEETINGIQKMVDLQKRYRNMLNDRNASGKTGMLMEKLFENPYVTISGAKKFLGVSYPTTRSVIITLVDAGILKKVDIIHKSKLFVAWEIEDALKV